MELLKIIGKPKIRYHYKLAFECSLVASLLLIILAFNFFPEIKKSAVDYDAPQELFTVEDIQQTKQDYTPPPPPEKPPTIIQAKLDKDLEDIEFGETEIDFDQELSAPPPPKEDKRIVEDEPVYFVAVEEMPFPIGGIEAILELIVYPTIAKRAGVEGKVFILAYINEEGNVEKTEILKGIGAGCDEAAEYAVKNTKFSPGKQRGKPVKVKVMIPVRFQLENKPS
jgi:protein TonB